MISKIEVRVTFYEYKDVSKPCMSIYGYTGSDSSDPQFTVEGKCDAKDLEMVRECCDHVGSILEHIENEEN